MPRQASSWSLGLWRQPLRVIIDGQQRLTGQERIFAQVGDILLAVTDARGSGIAPY